MPTIEPPSPFRESTAFPLDVHPTTASIIFQIAYVRLHNFLAWSIYITSLDIINIWICHLLPKNFCSNSLPARMWLHIIPLFYDFLLLGYLMLWACHCLTFVIQIPRLHNLMLKVFSLLPVRRMTFFILDMLMYPNYLFHREKWGWRTESCLLPNSYVEVLTGILVP